MKVVRKLKLFQLPFYELYQNDALHPKFEFQHWKFDSFTIKDVGTSNKMTN